MYKYEQELLKQNINYIAGTDEVGRGCLAGPLVTAAVILPKNYINNEIKDSKLLTEKKRNELAIEIKKIALSYAIIYINSQIVDEINPKQASRKGMKDAIEMLKIRPEHVLIDFEKIDITIPSSSIIKGDSKSISIAAASILAKVARDEYMSEIHSKFPYYNFASNKGYGTKEHLEALKKYGVTDFHRKSYKPIKNIINL